MITQKVIDTLYKKYGKRPQSVDELDVGLLFEYLMDTHEIEIDEKGNLIINSLPLHSPFHRISLSRVHAIVEFEKSIAIVLHSSIIFLNKHDSRSHVHIKQSSDSILSKIFRRAAAE